MKKIINLLLISVLLLPLSSCSSSFHVTDLMADITAAPLKEVKPLSDDDTIAITDFTLQLFQKEISDSKNTLLSPVSVMYALAMSANGANANTLTQIENALGMSLTELNSTLSAYQNALPQGDKYKLNLANSIWFKEVENFNVKKDFLQINADAYDAGLYQAPFNKSTLNAVNKWVSEHTDGMIENMLDQLSPDAMMLLINAITFDAKWQSEYTKQQVNDGNFTLTDGTTQAVEMMHSVEYKYLEDNQATGFIKYYADQKYAFAALLPNTDIKLSDYVRSLNSHQLIELLSHAQDIKVNTAIPKFEMEYSSSLNQTLSLMGMVDAFDLEAADFTGITDNNDLVISQVLHKTFIAVNEQGTKAGAATVVEMEATSAMPEPEEIKEVILNRPFLFMLIECETNSPIFIGTMMNIK